MNTQLLWDGLKAMILGMGMVYLFLILMIWIMNLTAKLLKPYAGFLEEKKTTPQPKRPAASGALSEEDIARAAIAAVQKFRADGNAGTPSVVEVPFRNSNLKIRVTPGLSAAAAAVEKTPEAAASSSHLLEVKSPLPGTIVKFSVNVGDLVSAGEQLAVIEAMKMETEIRAEFSGTVREILVSPKDVVASEQALLRMEVAK